MIRKISSRYAFSSQNRHRRSSIRIAIGLFFCTLALNVVIAFMIGLQDQRFSTIRTYESYDAIIETTDIENIKSIEKDLLAKNYTYFKYSEVPIIIRNTNGSSIFGTIRAFDEKDFDLLPYEFLKGNLNSNGIFLSYNQIAENSFKYGEEIEMVILKKGKKVPVVPLQLTNKITGVYFTPVRTFNNSFILMNRDLLLKYAPLTPTKIGIYGDTVNLKELVGNRAEVKTWKDQNQSLFAAMKLEQYLMYITLSIMSIIVLVHLQTSTKSLLNAKKGEIAMLRVMGMNKKSIVKIFSLQSLIISSVGVLSGTILSGILISKASFIINTLNRLTSGRIAVFTIPLDIEFSLTTSIIICIPILLLTLLISYTGSRTLLKNDSMEILINE